MHSQIHHCLSLRESCALIIPKTITAVPFNAHNIVQTIFGWSYRQFNRMAFDSVQTHYDYIYLDTTALARYIYKLLTFILLRSQLLLSLQLGSVCRCKHPVQYLTYKSIQTKILTGRIDMYVKYVLTGWVWKINIIRSSVFTLNTNVHNM